MQGGLLCEIVHTVTVGIHMQVTGEVKRIIADEEGIYLSIGDKVADAFRTGMAFRKSLKE